MWLDHMINELEDVDHETSIETSDLSSVTRLLAIDSPYQLTIMSDQDKPTIPPEVLAFAARMYDAARQGRLDVFEQALPAGLSANMTNDKGDSLVKLPP